MSNVTVGHVAKWRAEAERRKRLGCSADAAWAYNRIVDLAINHHKLISSIKWLDERLRAAQGEKP